MTDIDPSKVKAGDTVTLERDTALARDVVERIDPYPQGGFSIVLAETTPAYLTVTGWTLTDHQPAKPEWAPGTFGTATVSSADSVTPRTVKGVLGPDGMFAYATYDVVDVAEAGQWTDFVPAVVPERYRPVAPEWELGTVYEITTRDDDTVDAWCITGASPGHVVFLDQDGEEYDPSELLAITPQTSVDFTVAALRAEVSKLQTVINITDQAGADILDERNELLAEVERLRRNLEAEQRGRNALAAGLEAERDEAREALHHLGSWLVAEMHREPETRRQAVDLAIAEIESLQAEVNRLDAFIKSHASADRKALAEVERLHGVFEKAKQDARTIVGGGTGIRIDGVQIIEADLFTRLMQERAARTLTTRDQVESTLSKVLYATPYGELGWAPHRDRWATNATASDALAALLAPSVFALFEQGGAAQNQDAECFPDDCGGCACHIAPPCSHCVEHTTDDDA